MILLLLMLFQDTGFPALMLSMPDSAVGDCMVFIFEKDKKVQVGFYIMDDKPETKDAILHVSTFLEHYRDVSEKRLQEDTERLSLDVQAVDKLKLAIERQMSLIDRSATALSAEIAKTGLENQMIKQSDRVKAASVNLLRSAGHVNAANTLYTRILPRGIASQTCQIGWF